MSALRMARRSHRGIGLTALIDVVFILLMFFMLTSSFNRYGYFEFNTAGASGDAVGEAQVLLLLEDGALVERVARQVPLTDPMLLTTIDVTRSLSILPVADVDVQTLVMAIERLNSIGLSRVTLGQVIPGPAD